MEKKNVMLLAGAGQIGMAIARRMGYGMKIIVGDIKMLVNAAGVSPSQASVETILRVDLYGTAVLLEEVGKVISEGGAGATISSQSGFRMPALTAKEDELLACTPTEALLELSLLQPDTIRDTLHAYQLAKRCNEKRVMSQSVVWGKRGRLSENLDDLP